ncbi:MAG: PEP/pyruvate-binding domain-containing protein [Breznakibacter sp.]
MHFIDEHIGLSGVYNRRRTDRDIFQDLMPFKVKELLLVAAYYDAYAIVREGRLFDKVFGEYLQLNLFTAPRITSATTSEEALAAMDRVDFQMVILMAGLDMDVSIETGNLIKQRKPNVHILLLVNNNGDLFRFNETHPLAACLDKVFVWNGDSRVFVAMIKYVEDKMNFASDTEVGDVRAILLVEDSERYYSRYLPLLYSIVMMQTQELMSEDTTDQIHKMLKMRVRPKILLATTYEEAVEIIDRYVDNLLCVISDVKYFRNGIHEESAGVELIRYVSAKGQLPCLLQSSDPSNAEKARLVNADFIDKNSENLSILINQFLKTKLGFGPFEFTNSRGAKVATANNLREFTKCIEEVPAESLLFHARRNGISTWLMARGEIKLAQCLKPYQIEDFESSNKLRQTILNIFESVKLDRLKGREVMFDPELVGNSHFVMRLGDGSFGGKGRGVAFLSNFIENIDFEKLLPDINIGIPSTAIIGTAEFATFIDINGFSGMSWADMDDERIKQMFVNARLSTELSDTLHSYLKVMNRPLAVRSSGLFEDSLVQPFAGVYNTYLLPNNHPDIEVRFNHLAMAVKLVYGSVFSRSARAYFEAVHYKIEEEQMAVILQELVGHRAGERFYPNISGVAQSFNYYPFGYMKPEDGFAVLCVGLGKYVVGGEKAFRFCPKHPKLEHNSLSDQIKDSQTYFYALMLDQADFDLATMGEDATIQRFSIREAEEDGNLKHCAQVYDFHYEQLVNDFGKRGPRVVNFANIIKYDSVPLSGTLNLLLRFFKEALGAPVEIEFAVDLEPGHRGLPTLYLLQIKPLIRLEGHADVNFDSVDPGNVILQSVKGMGNGRIETISDVVYMDVGRFDRTKTQEMANEIDLLNKKMLEEGLRYVLIGPGRWGTRDKFTGIPVLWSQISAAKIIVEMGLQDFPLDASLGSHFFHNVTSMNVGYFSVSYGAKNEWVDLNTISGQALVHETHYFKHVRFERPLTILMNGREQKAVVVQNRNSSLPE